MKVLFDKKLYKKSAIDETIKSFSHLGDFSLSSQEQNYAVEVKKLPADIADMVKNEFCNHVLFLMNNR